MKKLIIALTLGFSLLSGSGYAHSIPPELLAFMASNPDASDEEMQAFLDESGLNETSEVWTADDNAQAFNMPPELIQFLIDNPDANEPEILTFIESQPSLADTDWAEKIKTLVDGDGFDESPFSLNDLVLLNQIGDTFDEAYKTQNDLNWLQFAKNYIVLGIEHILIGLDHILFVMSLVLLLPPWRKIIGMVTAFTLAHSVTLILGGTNILTISGSIVEPIIAASIAYMAFTTVFLSKKYPWFAQAHARLGVIFLFGLFHGLGFAGVFAEVAPEASRLLPSLLFFNVGVEIGQLVVLALFVPFLWALKHFKLDRYFVPFFAVIISALALWWVFVRIFF
ncbi:HupE/UreJ family protein [bacterium]|nr:HupE/UreJ family protein [bacterium]NCQ55351.1 HupE/UreJ family protein [Candidatus Parcubacteria bacterium]NCS96762.1 HupE/UreJ family protein [bacterium]